MVDGSLPWAVCLLRGSFPFDPEQRMFVFVYSQCKGMGVHALTSFYPLCPSALDSPVTGNMHGYNRPNRNELVVLHPCCSQFGYLPSENERMKGTLLLSPEQNTLPVLVGRRRSPKPLEGAVGITLCGGGVRFLSFVCVWCRRTRYP